ncbi:uncharacterized protein [Ptychodera flava]|uniref:uncharacterized protein n=1 Tax=Ptychodera flava TaxID=63121 RepID=UPI003969DF69
MPSSAVASPTLPKADLTICTPQECKKMWATLTKGNKQEIIGEWFQKSTQKLYRGVLNGNLSEKDMTLLVNYLCQSGRIIRLAVNSSQRVMTSQPTRPELMTSQPATPELMTSHGSTTESPSVPYPCGIIEVNQLLGSVTDNHLLTETDILCKLQRNAQAHGRFFVGSTQCRRTSVKKNTLEPTVNNFFDRFDATFMVPRHLTQRYDYVTQQRRENDTNHLYTEDDMDFQSSQPSPSFHQDSNQPNGTIPQIGVTVKEENDSDESGFGRYSAEQFSNQVEGKTMSANQCIQTIKNETDSHSSTDGICADSRADSIDFDDNVGEVYTCLKTATERGEDGTQGIHGDKQSEANSVAQDTGIQDQRDENVEMDDSNQELEGNGDHRESDDDETHGQHAFLSDKDDDNSMAKEGETPKDITYHRVSVPARGRKVVGDEMGSVIIELEDEDVVITEETCRNDNAHDSNERGRESFTEQHHRLGRMRRKYKTRAGVNNSALKTYSVGNHVIQNADTRSGKNFDKIKNKNRKDNGEDETQDGNSLYELLVSSVPSVNLCDVTLGNEASTRDNADKNQNSDRRVYKCSKCSESFWLKSRWKKHACSGKKKAAGKQYIRKCKICGYETRFVSAMRHHQESHSSVFYACHLCPKRYKFRGSFKHHMRSTHRIKDRLLCGKKETFLCQTCGKTFKHRCHLEEHLLLHSNDKQFECTCCSYKTSKITDLKRHCKTHVDGSELKCQKCGKCFRSELGFTLHCSKNKCAPFDQQMWITIKD